MDIHEKLANIGLHKSETKVYLYLLEYGLSTPPQIAKGTGIARTHCYHILQMLDEKALIQTQQNRKRKNYIARDPESLISTFEKRQEMVKQVVPELRDLFTTQKNKPKIRFFSGWEEVKEVFRLTLEAEKIFALGSTEALAKIDPKFFDWYPQELDKRKIIFDDILTADAKGKTAEEITKIRGALHTIKFLPEQFGDQPMDIFIWDDNIAFMALSEPIFATLMTDASLVKAIKVMHRALWEKL
jgi:sugar-specific transcriptional regulator TrmB